jgi:phosphopantothenoylcysteine decarboxylase/phosphopantothenate--cysteine ligase
MANILIGITGGISAYKIPSVISVLVDKGHNVQVIMTEAAKKFITPLTFSSLSHNPVYDDSKEFYGNDGHIWHVELANWADVFAIAPMTANTGMKVANHLADNLLTSTALVYHKNPILLFPAMNLHMWKKFKEGYLNCHNGEIKVYRNLEDIEYFNPKTINAPNILIQPATGKMACGDIGEGKLVDTRTIVSVIEKMVTI